MASIISITPITAAAGVLMLVASGLSMVSDGAFKRLAMLPGK
jgi:uncharacterized membrane protein YqgA involved in biofilm formation